MTWMAETPGYQTKTEWIYSQMQDMIKDGELASGERLPLAPLAERFGTSEIPVREAMRMLHRDGLVRIESHRGATVASVSWDQLYEAIFIRSYLEILAIGEAVPRHEDGSLEIVHDALVRMDELAAEPTGETASVFSTANRAFHTSLYAPCPYPLLLGQIDDLWDRLWRTRSQSLFYMAREQMLRAQAEHWEMYEAAAAHDARRAARVATKHRGGNLTAWQRIIDESTADEPGPVTTDAANAAAKGGGGRG
jgi:DNA-binding GntR family transcriptional regulator